MTHKYVTLEDTVPFWFGANDTSGSGNDGASAVYDVRLAGAAAGAIPTLSGSATLLSHANYPAGSHEVLVAATAANGFAVDSNYGVFCTLAVDSQNPTGFIGSFLTTSVQDAVWDEILTGATHNIATSAGRRLRQLQVTLAYDNGQVWVDTLNGTAGVVPFENGTSGLPSLTWADAVTVADDVEVNLSDYHIINGSSVTFVDNRANTSMFGDNWALALGGQTITGVYVQGAHVSGIGTAASEVNFEGCEVHTASIQYGHFDFCSFATTVTHTLAGDYNYHNCYSNVPGAGSPTFAKTAGQAITAQFRNWAGSITFSGLEVGDTLTVGGTMGTIDLGSPAGAVVVEIRGSYKEIINIGSAACNIDGAVNTAQVVDDVWDEPIAGHIALGTTGLSEALGGAAIVDTTVAGTPTSTTIELTAGSATDDFYNDQNMYILSGTGVGQARIVLSYNGTTKVVTIDEPWAITPAATDRVVILIDHVHPISQIANTVLTTQMTEAYAADGTAPTLAQALMLIQQSLGDFSISGTTLTVNKLDGAATAATFTLDSSTAPTSTTRAT